MKTEKFSAGVRVVSQVAVELRDAIIELAGNRAVFDSRALWLERAARAAGISARMAKALFYGEVADPKSSVVEKVRAARARKADNARKTLRILADAKQTARQEDAGHSELSALRERVAILEAVFLSQNKDAPVAPDHEDSSVAVGKN